MSTARDPSSSPPPGTSPPRSPSPRPRHARTFSSVDDIEYGFLGTAACAVVVLAALEAIWRPITSLVVRFAWWRTLPKGVRGAAFRAPEEGLRTLHHSDDDNGPEVGAVALSIGEGEGGELSSPSQPPKP
jgi:hypothetical protein